MSTVSAAALAELRRDLAAALRLAARFDLHEGICNHFSVALPGAPDRFLINPLGFHWSEVTASDLCVVDGSGQVVEGRHPVEATALHIHGPMHRANPAARCVLHTHMPYATALTLVDGGRLEMVSQNALRFYERIAYDDDYQGLALDDAEGERMAAVLGSKPVLFLANHGVIVTAPTLAEAFDELYYLERAAMAQVLAAGQGRPLRRIGDNLAAHVCRQTLGEVATQAHRHYAALKRLLDREDAGYAD